MRNNSYIFWFPRKYKNASSKSFRAMSNLPNRKLLTPHWK